MRNNEISKSKHKSNTKFSIRLIKILRGHAKAEFGHLQCWARRCIALQIPLYKAPTRVVPADELNHSTRINVSTQHNVLSKWHGLLHPCVAHLTCSETANQDWKSHAKSNKLTWKQEQKQLKNYQLSRNLLKTFRKCETFVKNFHEAATPSR